MRREICWPEKPNTGSVSPSPSPRIAFKASIVSEEIDKHLARPLRVGLGAAHEQPAGAVGRAADIRPRQHGRLAAAQHAVEHHRTQRNIDPAPGPGLLLRFSSAPAADTGAACGGPDRGQVFTRNPFRLFLRACLPLAGEAGQHGFHPVGVDRGGQIVLPVPVADGRGSQAHGRRSDRLCTCGQVGGDRDRCGRQGCIAPFPAPARETASQAVVGAEGGRGPGSCDRSPDAFGVRFGQNDLCGVGIGDGGVAAGDGCGQRLLLLGKHKLPLRVLTVASRVRPVVLKTVERVEKEQKEAQQRGAK